MSRETGWYRVWCRTDLRWTFREFFDGEWEDHGNYMSERDFKIAYEVPEQAPVNPVPANKTVIEYAIQEYGKDGATIHTTCDHLDSYDEAMEFKSGSLFPDDAWVVQFKTETRVVEGGE